MVRRIVLVSLLLAILSSLSAVTFFIWSRKNDSAKASHARMLQVLGDIMDQGATDHAFLGNRGLLEARDHLEQLPPDAPPATRISYHVLVGYQELRLGQTQQAVNQLESAYKLLEPAGDSVSPGARRDVLMKLAIAHLRQGELQNCIENHTSESCLFPIQGTGIHRDPTGATAAIRYLTEFLQFEPEDLEARWLLNLAYMTVGDYPEGVPVDLLIPPDAFDSGPIASGSREGIPRFVDVASNVGLDLWSLAGGSVVDDFDGDGRLDIFVSDWAPNGQCRYFHHEADGTFTDQTERAGLLGIFGGLNAIQADYDNDGDTDILVLRGAWLSEGGQHPNSLLRNEGDNRFLDMTFASGLGEIHYPTQTAAWSDYDNDGDLDLYVGNEVFPSQLFENDGRGNFRDIAIEAGVANDRMAKAVVWGDFNADDLPDLYVANLGSGNRLYRNNGNGSFTDMAPLLGVTEPTTAFPSWFWDYNNDGVLDIYSSSYELGVQHLAADALGLPLDVEQDRLYEGDGRGGFRDVTQERGLTSITQPMGANFGDMNNDGYLDFYLGTGYPEYEALMPNLLFYNDRGKRFVNITSAARMGHLQKGHGVAFADLDNDGDQDIFTEMGGWYPGDAFANALYENPGFGHHWLTIRLVGTQSNRSAIGARIRVDLKMNDSPGDPSEGSGGMRSVYRWIGSGGSFGASPLRCEIGLGTAEQVERLEVYWPTTGKTQVFQGIEADQFIEIREGESTYRELEAPATPFSRSSPGGPHDHSHTSKVSSLTL